MERNFTTWSAKEILYLIIFIKQLYEAFSLERTRTARSISQLHVNFNDTYKYHPTIVQLAQCQYYTIYIVIRLVILGSSRTMKWVHETNKS